MGSGESPDSDLHTWDFVAVAAYFAAVLGAGLYSMCRSNRGTVSGYFLAGRFMTWLPVGASLFASNIGSEHFIGLAGSGAASGIAVAAFELNSCILLQLLGWVFLPVYIASRVCTLPEFMKKRFGGTRIRMYLATLSLVLYIFTKISVNLYSGALFIQQALHWSLYPSVFLILLATAFCTVTGGLAAVIYTDTLQAFVMVAGACTLTIISFIKVGGIEGLYYKYMEAIPTLPNGTWANNTCGHPRADSWIMLRDPVDSDLPWPGFIFGQTPASIWYWCADQMMVQRTLAAKSLSHAQGGTLFAGYLKLLPLFVMVLPGMISRVLFTDEVGCADPETCMAVCGNAVGCSNIAYPKLVLKLMPTGLKGVMLSVMLAALMSDLTSIFNSASTLFTMDVYKFIRKKASVRELMIVGRLFVCVMVVVGIVWIPAIQGMQGGELYHYIQSIAAYLSPPIAAIYLVAILWKRGNEQGAFWGLMIGMVCGVIRMVLDFVFRAPACGEEDLRPSIVAKVHYMYFALILFVLTILVMVVVSLLTEPPCPGRITRTTYWTRYDRRIRLDEKTELEIQQIREEEEALKERPEDMALVVQYTVEPGNDSKGAGGDYQKAAKDDQEKILISEKPTTNGFTEHQVDPEPNTKVEQSSSKALQFVKRGYNWFCGFDESEEGIKKALELQEHLEKITSLEQDPRAKIGLLICMVTLIVLAIFLYAFFSTGIDFTRL